jgi:hypothetical protein
MAVKDIVEPILKDMSGGLGSVFGVKLTDVLKTPAQFSPSGASLADAIATTVVMPVAATILVVLCMLELSRMAVQTDGDGEVFTKRAIFTLVKFGLVFAFFRIWPRVMAAIYGVFAELATKANGLVSTSTAVSATSMEGFLETLDDMDWLGQTIIVVTLLIAWVVNKIAIIAALALVVQRFVKLFVFSAFAPMPFSFFAEEHTRSWGLGFLRNYGATVLQSLVLVLAFALYQAMTQGWANQAFNDLDENATAAALSIGASFIFLGVLLGTIVLGSGRLANELLGN